MRSDTSPLLNPIAPQASDQAGKNSNPFSSPPSEGKSASSIPHFLISAGARAVESIVAGLTGFSLWYAFYQDSVINSALLYSIPIAVVAIAFPLLANARGLYSIRALSHPARSILSLAAVWSALFLGIVAVAFLSKTSSDFSRMWVSAWLVSGFGFLALERFGVSGLVARWRAQGRLALHAVLVGGGNAAADLCTAIAASEEGDIIIDGIFDDRDDERSPAEIAGLKKIGGTSDLVQYVRDKKVDLILVTFPLTAESRLLQVMKKLWVLPVNIRLSAYSQKLRYRPHAYTWIGNVPFLDVYDRPLSNWSGIQKSVLDKALAILAIIAFSPVMLAVAIAVKLNSRGPVLFCQSRYGFNNEEIKIYKFRSMYHHMADANAEKLVTRTDDRVTAVGRFIRRTSLDEIPQFFNVLRGDLSLVGPRPHSARAKAGDYLYDDVVEGYFARHKVKPGVTGWAQINGWRGETDTAEKIQHRVEHDLYYIENWSLRLDLYILWRTPFALLKGEGAY